MQLNTISHYKPLEIQSDYSVSNARREIYIQSLQNELKKSGVATQSSIPLPNLNIQTHSYLTSNTTNLLSFKNTLEQEQTLATKAISQMQDFLTLPNLSEINKNLNAKDSKNTFEGYSVDKNGFMGEDFNKAAGLPSDYKIHKETLDKMYAKYVKPNTMLIPSEASKHFTLKNGVYYSRNLPLANGQSHFDKLDIASVFKWAYSQLEPLAKDFTKDFYTIKELNQYFPAGIAYDSQNNATGEVTLKQVYHSQKELESALEKNKSLSTFALDNGAKNLFCSLDKSSPIHKNDFYLCDETYSISKYINDDKISKEGLLIAFIAQQGAVFKAQSPETIKSEYQKSWEKFEQFYYGGDSIKNYSAIKEGILSTNDFIQSSIECNMWLYYYFMKGNKEPHLLPDNIDISNFLEWEYKTPNAMQLALQDKAFMEYANSTISSII
ncbi:Cj0814 family flagellar-dependent secreted protein [Helicobacter turcicus]|uniref:Lipoprotein n=1 Tax=Helicobacter turcicus TaxID=2867412 RepID=A0ABS7JNP7_9HELI|nr:hypothetical protein [Helicobacter turcicus]MBX7491028.1 hypothetical protein [Helicobacter turcicus]MBX7545845.1 hypothetical protein [Helicobacter turcicus]